MVSSRSGLRAGDYEDCFKNQLDAENISVTQPVVLLQRDIGFDQYLALLCEADVFVVSSMREGLNLTCHEFITATEDKKSPLMLSEFTGSSNLLLCKGEGAILINPWILKVFGNHQNPVDNAH